MGASLPGTKSESWWDKGGGRLRDQGTRTRSWLRSPSLANWRSQIMCFHWANK